MPSAAHLSNIEQADEFNKAMIGFSGSRRALERQEGQDLHDLQD